MKFFGSLLAALALAGCAQHAPESAAQQSENAACTAQADAAYNQNTLNLQGRTPQTGLRFGATPTQVFDGEVLGAQHVRDSQIQNCEQTGNNNGQPVVNGVPVVAPHIITQ